MKRRTALALGAGVVVAAAGEIPAAGSTGVSRPVPDAVLAGSLPGGFRSAHLQVNGTNLHYVVGGRGRPLVLLPGWPQTWWQFQKILPALARQFRVIAVDLRGMGSSAKPEGGYDKKTMARDVYELVRKLGYEQVDVVGHDIGAMVAHSFAANHRGVVRKVSLLDVPHPDETLFELTLVPRLQQPFFLWWFAFNQVAVLPEQLLAGRFHYLIDHLFELLLRDQASISERDRAIFARAYAPPDAIRAGNAWYKAFSIDVEDEKSYSKLEVPVLGLASAGNDGYLSGPLSRQAIDYRVVTIEDSGHYLAEEQPEAVVRELAAFHR